MSKGWRVQSRLESAPAANIFALRNSPWETNHVSNYFDDRWGRNFSRYSMVLWETRPRQQRTLRRGIGRLNGAVGYALLLLTSVSFIVKIGTRK